jgi:hypothetical protein
MIRKLVLLISLNLFISGIFASERDNFLLKTDSIPANVEDVKSIDAIIKAVYDVISGDSGVKRNWDRMRTLFIPEARLISTGVRRDGTIWYRVMMLEDYIRLAGPTLEKGFIENELSRKTDRFGNIAHVFSTYESKLKLTDAKPFTRGINSIQLMYDGKRWWVVNIYWTSESPADPIPKQYLNN